MSLEMMTSIDLNENAVTGIPDNIQTVGGKRMVTLDSALSDSSGNPVQNRAIKLKFDQVDTAINNVNDRIDNLDLNVSVDNVTIKKDANDTLYGVGAGHYVNNTLKGEVFNLANSQTSNVASGSRSHAEGNSTTASGDNSHSEGNSTTASGSHSHAEGASTKAEGYYSHAEGNSTTASGWASHAEGDTSKATGNSSHAEGYSCSALDSYAHAEGYSTSTKAQKSHVEGAGATITSAQAFGAHAEGEFTTVTAEAAHAEGYHTTAAGNYCHAEGEYTTAADAGAHAEGEHSQAVKPGAHAEGTYCQAVANYAHAEGTYSVASGSAAHAEGSNTKAIGVYAHSEGEYTMAVGKGSHAEGHGTSSVGSIANYSHTEGYDNLVNGEAGHAEGRDNKITGSAATYSHAEGNSNTIALATESHIEGYKNKINGAGSAYHVEGYMNTYTPGSAATSGIYGSGSHLGGVYNTLTDGFGGTSMSGALNYTGGVWAKSSLVAGIANRVNNLSAAIGCGLMGQDHCVTVGNRNEAPQTGGINLVAYLEYTGTTNLTQLYDPNCAIIMKSSGTVSEIIICVADTDTNLTKGDIIGLNVNGTVVDPQYYSLTNDISDRTAFTTTPYDLSIINGYYLIIDAQGFTADPNDEYTIKIAKSHVIGDKYIFSVGNGMFAETEDCGDNHRANALAVTYDGDTEVQKDLTFKYVDNLNVKHRISLQKVVDALLSLNISITDLEA